jgi:hypothetical protein
MADPVRTDPWPDLVYHVLTHLRVSKDDASSLYSERYVDWATELMKDAPAPQGLQRTLPDDAQLLARLYDAAPSGFRIHAFPSLWDDVESFLADMPRDFRALEWDDARREALAKDIAESVGTQLSELLRTAVWSEWQCGYASLWERNVRPRAETYLPVFRSHLAVAAKRLPGLNEQRLTLCHPLRVHGRVLAEGILVGVMDEELGVGELDPLLQACHEQLVCLVQSQLPQDEAWATQADRAGHAAFMEVEGAALTAGMHLFADGLWAKDYREWLGRAFHSDGESAAQRLADGEFLTPRARPVVKAITS